MGTGSKTNDTEGCISVITEIVKASEFPLSIKEILTKVKAIHPEFDPQMSQCMVWHLLRRKVMKFETGRRIKLV